MSNPITPMVAVGVVSYANNWYNTKSVTDVKPLLFAGVAALLLKLIAAGIGDEAATLLGWTGFVGVMISPVQKPSPIDNLLSLGKPSTPTGTKPAPATGKK
jgi:hypothetical protein